MNLIEFDTNHLKTAEELKLSNEEENLLNKINEISTSSEYDNVIPEDDIGFAGIKLNQLGITTYVFLFFGIVISFVIIFGGFYLLKKDKKPVKEKKKKQ